MFWQKSTKVFWTTNEVYAKAFHTLARGLWLTLGGMAAVLVGAAVFGLPLLLVAWFPALAEFSRQLVIAAGVFLVVGTLLNLWGKWTCFELQQPLEHGQRLPGHRYLQAAFWCEVVSFVLKTSARTLGVVQLRFLVLPLAIISQIAFLLFLRKVADVIERPELKRRIDWLGISVAACLLMFGIAAIGRNAGLGPRVPLVAMLISGALFLISLLGYIVLLAQMALASSAFARYLEKGHDHEESYEEAEGVAEESAT
jgi:hypothetical protein